MERHELERRRRLRSFVRVSIRDLMVKSRPHKHKPSVAGTAAASRKVSRLPPGSACRPGRAPRAHECTSWADCELADLEAAEDDAGRTGLWMRGHLIRRTIGDGDLAFFSTWCPAGTAIATLVAVEGASLGDRGRVRDRQDRAGARSLRFPLFLECGQALARVLGLGQQADLPFAERDRLFEGHRAHRLHRIKPAAQGGGRVGQHA